MTAAAPERVSGLLVETRVADEATADGSVEAAHLADGTLVRLTGFLSHHHLPQLRHALLMPLPAQVRDVVVDLGRVDAVDDAVMSVLLAAQAWTQANGRRFFLSARSAVVDEALHELDAPAGALPSLSDARRR